MKTDLFQFLQIKSDNQYLVNNLDGRVSVQTENNELMYQKNLKFFTEKNHNSTLIP